jgi:predicted O-methyltransferase YrrM
MADEIWNDVDDFVSARFVQADSALDAALAASKAAGLPEINVAPNQGKLLMLLAQAMGARRILEVGTLGGYSTIWLARGLAPGGSLVTLEANPDYAKVAGANLARAGIADRVEIRVGRALDTLPQLAADGAGPFDLVFIDADKPPTAEYFQWALKLSRPGGVIIVDNVVREGAILDADSEDRMVQGIRRFFDAVAAEPRVDATVIQTVGGKGHDGMAILRVSAAP